MRNMPLGPVLDLSVSFWFSLRGGASNCVLPLAWRDRPESMCLSGCSHFIPALQVRAIHDVVSGPSARLGGLDPLAQGMYPDNDGVFVPEHR